MKKQQIQQQEQLSAYDKKVIYDMFYMSIEWLEKYIEIAYKKEFPDWENRKQIRDDLNITRTDIYSNPEKVKKAFSTQMFLFGTTLEEDAPILREALKKEFHQWIGATKMDNNCPNELKHLLYGFNEVMDGNIEKVREDMANRKREYEIDSPEYMERMNRLFSNVQVPMHGEREAQQNLAGKTHLSMEFGNRFSGGNVEQGEQAFGLITGAVAGEHKDFHFYPQKEQQQLASNNANNNIIGTVRQNSNNWKIETIQGQTWLIHNSAQRIDSEVGILIHNRQRFTDTEWAEVQQVISANQYQAQQVQRPGDYSWR